MNPAELDEAMELMHFAWRRVITEPDRILAELELGRLHHRVLYVVRQNPDLAIGELIDLLGVSKQALHRPVKELAAAGMLVAIRAKGDRRVKHLRLTPQGKRYERRLARAEYGVFIEAFERAGPRAVQQWRHVMNALSLGRRLRVPELPDQRA